MNDADVLIRTMQMHGALLDEQRIAQYLGALAGAAALRLDATPREVIENLLEGGAFDDAEWAEVTKPRLERLTRNTRALHAGVTIAFPVKRPQG